MFIKKLQLKNYRNYVSEEFVFSNGINIVRGNNAQGKTNCAEAIFYLCTGYSPRAAKDKQVIMYGADSAEASGEAESLYGSVNVSVCFNSSGKKEIKVNGAEIGKIGELLGNINSVFFNPGELKLVQESPEDRRRFMDISLSQMNRNYFYALQRYKKILQQRNNLLKDENKQVIYETLSVWDSQLAESGSKIILARNEFVKALSPFAKQAHAFVSDNKEDLEVVYDFKYDGGFEEVKAGLIRELNEKIERDMILGYTTAGPHRDDIKLKVNGEDVKVYGSQGQQRTVALSLKLAELEIFRNAFGEYPVLILDDALSELDKGRQKKLMERIKGVQTIITCTHIDEEVFDGINYNEYVIENGAVKSKEIKQ